MDEAKVLELARAAGVDELRAGSRGTLIAFARLVAAAERKGCEEACSKVARKHHRDMAIGSESGHNKWLAAVECADAIRSRTE